MRQSLKKPDDCSVHSLHVELNKKFPGRNHHSLCSGWNPRPGLRGISDSQSLPLFHKPKGSFALYRTILVLFSFFAWDI